MSEQLYDKLRRLSPKVAGGLIKLRSDTFKDSAVPAKFKILSALAIVVATKCEPCIIGYTKMAYEAGTTEGELVEFLNVAITESGCPGEQWAMVALKTYRELEAGKRFAEADICCHDKNTN
jgi:AhpD family alkylhydroperoxidase